MELHAKNTSQEKTSTNPDPKPGLDEDPNYGKTLDTHDSQHLFEDFDSSCSTPYVSAPSSPGRAPVKGGGFFYSCPASPMHFAAITTTAAALSSQSSSDSDEFEFLARSGSTGSGQTGSMTTMSSADELFLNGKIRPMKLSTHLERPQVLAPLLDLENEDEEGDDHCYRGGDLRLRDNKSLRRRTRSMSPLRSSTLFEFNREELENAADSKSLSNINGESVKIEEETTTTTTSSSTPSVSSASSSRSSSAGRNSKRWVFLKDFLYRSKSEGRSPNNKFWPNISFSPSAKDKKSINNTITATASSVQVEEAEADSKDKGNGNVSRATVAVGNNTQKVKVSGQGSGKRTVNGVGKSRRVVASPHELHYKASRAQAEEMRKKTFLPYRHGLLGCLGFSSKGYGAMNGFARALNPVSSR